MDLLSGRGPGMPGPLRRARNCLALAVVAPIWQYGHMAGRKMTVAAKLRAREEQLIRACEIADRDPDVLAIEREWDALANETAEAWTGAPSR